MKFNKLQFEILNSINEFKEMPTEEDLEISFDQTFELTEPYYCRNLQRQTEESRGNKYSKYAQKLLRKVARKKAY